jgi:hypothetical protein
MASRRPTFCLYRRISSGTPGDSPSAIRHLHLQMLVAERAVAVFPAPVIDRGHRIIKMQVLMTGSAASVWLAAATRCADVLTSAYLADLQELWRLPLRRGKSPDSSEEPPIRSQSPDKTPLAQGSAPA